MPYHIALVGKLTYFAACDQNRHTVLPLAPVTWMDIEGDARHRIALE